MLDKQFLKSMRLDPHGAIRGDDFLHNARWYDRSGQYLGWGDISREDLTQLAAQIPEGEEIRFVYEGDTWRKSASELTPEEVEKLHAWRVRKGIIEKVHRDTWRKAEVGPTEYKGMHYTVVEP